MTKEAGRDIGSKIGRVMEVDKRSWQADQEKFMCIRIELPIEKPLRRGGYVSNMDGDRCWVCLNMSDYQHFVSAMEK